PGLRILRADGADVEASDAVLAAQEQLLEDRQFFRPAEGMDVLELPAEAERHPAVLSEVPDALEHRLVEVGIAAQTGQIDRQRIAAPGGRRDRIVDRIVNQV